MQEVSGYVLVSGGSFSTSTLFPAVKPVTASTDDPGTCVGVAVLATLASVGLMVQVFPDIMVVERSLKEIPARDSTLVEFAGPAWTATKHVDSIPGHYIRKSLSAYSGVDISRHDSPPRRGQGRRRCRYLGLVGFALQAPPAHPCPV